MRSEIGFRSAWIVLGSLAIAGLLAACDPFGGGGGGSSKPNVGDNDIGKVLCLGDSITEGDCAGDGAPYPSILAGISGKTTINQGSCGEKSVGGASRIGTLLERYSPGYICILYGANDAIFDLPTDEVVNNLRSMIQAAKNNQTIVLLATLTPMYDGHGFAAGNVANYNVAIRELAKQEKVKLVDLEKEFGTDRSLLQADGLHPTAAGNQVMALAFNDKL